MARTLHTDFTEIHIHTAKCDLCNQRNRSTLQRCTACGWSICAPCFLDRGSDGSHLINQGDIGWTTARVAAPPAPAPEPEPPRGRRRARRAPRARRPSLAASADEPDDGPAADTAPVGLRTEAEAREVITRDSSDLTLEASAPTSRGSRASSASIVDEDAIALLLDAAASLITPSSPVPASIEGAGGSRVERPGRAEASRVHLADESAKDGDATEWHLESSEQHATDGPFQSSSQHAGGPPDDHPLLAPDHAAHVAPRLRLLYGEALQYLDEKGRRKKIQLG
ncbi:MAG: hypothetical protein M1838_003358 [Thelocarpon superellum]|nr:MAG: hypothetical protein M1838_003358 [Thelocarpon superellum]